MPTFEKLSPAQVDQLVVRRRKPAVPSADGRVMQLPLPGLQRRQFAEIAVPAEVGAFTSYVRFVSVEPTKNRHRFYQAEWQPLLWGGGALVRTWGRIGALGQTARVEYLDRQSAQVEIDRLIRRRLARRYTLIAWA